MPLAHQGVIIQESIWLVPLLGLVSRVKVSLVPGLDRISLFPVGLPNEVFLGVLILIKPLSLLAVSTLLIVADRVRLLVSPLQIGLTELHHLCFDLYQLRPLVDLCHV